MNELIPCEKEGQCEYTGLNTYYKFRGHYVSEHFLIASRKLWLKFKDSEPDLTFDKCVEIIIGAQSYRVLMGDAKMEVSELKKGVSWKHKVKKMLYR